MLTRRSVLAATAAAAFWRPEMGAAAEIEPHALDDFFAAPVTRDAALSPSGKRLAVLIERKLNGKRKALVLTSDAAAPADIGQQVIVGDDSYDVNYVEWASEDRLLVTFTREFTRGGRPVIGSRLGRGDSAYSLRRVAAIDADGSDPVILFDNKNTLLRSNFDLSQIVDTLPDDPAHVLMLAAEPQSGAISIYRVNVNTGEAKFVERGGSSTFNFYTHNGVAVLREDAERRGSVVVIRARAPGEREWKVVRRMRGDQWRDFFVVTGTDRPDVLIVGARLEGEDVVSVRELNMRTLAYGAPLSQRAGRDAAGGAVDERRRLIATKYIDDRTTYDFTDKSLAAHYRAMNRFFDDEANVDLWDVDHTHTRFLARVSGPREPGSFYIYDKGAKRLDNLGALYPDLDPARLGKTEVLKVKTRDGAQITAYLTAPPTGRPGPLVVLAHGGPEARDQYGWDRQVQVFAAQGWWVIQPNFRGSGGFGRAFAQAGWRRWGDLMQDDVEDAVAQAIALRGLDARRVAIMGTSYGGYAALMGAAKRPDLYKAAVSICGVTDLPDILAWERREDESGDKWLYRHWVDRIGDPSSEMAKLEAASPRRLAKAFTMPVMLVHGENDGIVPVAQSRAMHRALKSAGKRVEYEEVRSAGHADWEDDVEHGLMKRYVALFSQGFKA